MLLKNCYVARKARERNPIAKKILIVTSAYARPYTLWGGGGEGCGEGREGNHVSSCRGKEYVIPSVGTL